MTLHLYNSLTHRKEEFRPIDSQNVRMYVCGPTVYDYAHIGNARAVVVFDLLYRVLRHEYGPDHVTYVRNITDVEDKIIDAARVNNEPIAALTARTEQIFQADMDALGNLRPNVQPRATEHIAQMIAMIEKLIAGGHAYAAQGHALFRVASFSDYGKLSRRSRKEMIAGARVEVAPYKEDPGDFVLWKPSAPDQPGWDSPWGRGRPGWHIECSAMSEAHLGRHFDIHGGGIDLVFPHHENEIAQSESLTGKPFARFWLHAEFLMVEGQKMSKSLGNYFTLRDILGRGYAPEAVRYLLASVPYRKTLNFTFDGLQSAKTAIERLRNFKRRLETGAFAGGLNQALADRTAAAEAQFTAAMDDDLNTAEALASVFEYVRDVNTAMDAGEFRSGNGGPALDFVQRCDSVFDVLTPTSESGQVGDAEVESLVRARDEAKKARNFALADQIRQQLQEQGIILEDTKSGTRWKRKSP